MVSVERNFGLEKDFYSSLGRVDPKHVQAWPQLSKSAVDDLVGPGCDQPDQPIRNFKSKLNERTNLSCSIIFGFIALTCLQILIYVSDGKKGMLQCNNI